MARIMGYIALPNSNEAEGEMNKKSPVAELSWQEVFEAPYELE